MRIIISLFCIIMYITDSLAINDKIYPNKLNSCTITESAINDYEPEKFGATNNLLRSTGRQPIFCGTKIIIKGRILDENCVPISDAKIYLWQVGCDGKYPYQPLRNRIDQNLLNLDNGSSFTGSGTATSNNQGEFVFITIYPPALKAEKAHLNFRIQHHSLGVLQTKFYLSNEHIIEEIDNNDPLLEDSTRIYDFEVVMPGETTKRY